MQTERRVAANPQTKPTNLGTDMAVTIHIHHRHLLLLLTLKADTHFSPTDLALVGAFAFL